ncbi:MAG: peptidoglycan D,D-transpeptidase FtsI family protein, partial [Minisyncoccales bacterium]
MRISSRVDLRENFILFLFFLIFLIFLGRLYFIQIKKGDYYRALIEGLYNRFFFTNKERGKIYSRDGQVLAMNKDVFSLIFVLKEEKTLEKEVSKLSQILKEEKEALWENLINNKTLILKKELSDEELEKIKKEKFENFQLILEKKRFYPQKELASHLLGFQNKEGKGQYGLEEYYDKELQNGNDLFLTLDISVQAFGEKIIKDFQEKLGYQKGEILVVSAKTGEILAFVNFPNFDPNSFSQIFQENSSIFLNFSSQELFEPGSILKPITMAAGLQEQLIEPWETYRDPGQVIINGWVIKNYDGRNYGFQTMTNVLEKSINTGVVYVQKKLGKEKFLNYLSDFGLFEKTNVDLPEVYSQNKNLRKGYEINLATASFGQGIEITSLQLIKAYLALINEGKMMKLFLVKKMIDQGKEKEFLPEVEKSVISS